MSQVKLIEPLAIDASSSYGEVRRLFRETGVRISIVVDDKGRLAGVIYRSSVLRITSRKSSATARDLAVEPPAVITPDAKLSEALNLMLKLDEWYLPVVEKGYVSGLLGMESIIEVLLSEGYLKGLEAGSFMTRDPLYVEANDPLYRVWEVMVSRKYAGLPVVRSSEDRRLAGIVTQYDLIKKGYTRIELEASTGPTSRVKVSDAMNPSVHYIYPWTPLEEAAALMVSRGWGRLPVVDSRESRVLTGIIDREDIVKTVLRRREGVA